MALPKRLFLVPSLRDMSRSLCQSDLYQTVDIANNGGPSFLAHCLDALLTLPSTQENFPNVYTAMSKDAICDLHELAWCSLQWALLTPSLASGTLSDHFREALLPGALFFFVCWQLNVAYQ